MLKGLGDFEIVEEAVATEDINNFMLEKPYDPSFLGQAEDVREYFNNPDKLTSIQKNLVLLKEHMRDGDTILDVGCYGGYTYDWLLKNFPEKFNYAGIDVQAEAIEEAWKAHGADIRDFPYPCFYVMDLFDMPPHWKNSWDVVFCSRVAIHLPSFEEIVRCLWAVTRRSLLITVKLGEDRAIRQRINDQAIVYFRYISEETIDQTMARLGLTYKLFKNGKYQTIVIGETP